MSFESRDRREGMSHPSKDPNQPRGDQDLKRSNKPSEAWSRRMVPMTNSTQWGTGRSAIARADSEIVNEENESLCRTFHRSLSSHNIVWVMESIFGPPVWVVPDPVPDTEAGGRQIHVIPGRYPNWFPGVPTTLGEELFPDPINPRKLLTEDDLNKLRILYPKLVGARAYLSGFITILFEYASDVKDARSNGYPTEVGGLIVIPEVMKAYTVQQTEWQCVAS